MDYAIFESLLKAHKATVYRVSKATGIAPSTFSDWKSGRSIPKADKLRRVAEYFGITLDELLRGNIPPDAETVSREEPLGCVKRRNRVRLPIIGEIRAGSPIITNETVLGYEYADVENTEDYFYLRVCGDSMKNCGMVDGSLVLFRKQSYAEEGNIVACLVGGESATVKRFSKEGHRIFLCPENEDYRPIELSPIDFETGEARILGVAVEVRIHL